MTGQNLSDAPTAVHSAGAGHERGPSELQTAHDALVYYAKHLPLRVVRRIWMGCTGMSIFFILAASAAAVLQGCKQDYCSLHKVVFSVWNMLCSLGVLLLGRSVLYRHKSETHFGIMLGALLVIVGDVTTAGAYFWGMASKADKTGVQSSDGTAAALCMVLGLLWGGFFIVGWSYRQSVFPSEDDLKDRQRALEQDGAAFAFILPARTLHNRARGASLYGKLPEEVVSAVQTENLAVLQDWLSKPGASLEETEPEKHQTALIIAARAGKVHSLELLLHMSANPNTRMSGGATAVYVAAQEGRQRCVQLLVRHGANVEVRTSTGSFPLFIAARQDRRDCVNLLLRANADPNAALPNGTTPLMIAVHEGHLRVATTLLQAGADVNARCDDGATALFAATSRGALTDVKMLLQAGADPNLEGHGAITPLIAAAEFGSLSCCHALIQGDADINARAADGSTALLGAADTGQRVVVQLLLRNKAQMELATEDGCTPLFLAAQHGHVGIVDDLIAAGANLNAKRPDGTSVLQMARLYHPEIAEKLVEAGARPLNKRQSSASHLRQSVRRRSRVPTLIHQASGLSSSTLLADDLKLSERISGLTKSTI